MTFFIKETPVRGIKAEYNEEAISKHKRNRIDWFKDHNPQEVLNEMKTIRTVSIQRSRKKYTTELTQFQKQFFELIPPEPLYS